MPPRPPERPPSYGVGAVEGALALLGALARIGPASLAALAAEANCTRTRAFRLLRTLEAGGYALQDGARGTWRLGAGWWLLGRAAAGQRALQVAALPHLARLSEATGENTYLLVRDGGECEVALLHQSSPLLRAYAREGQRRPLHAGAGRLLLAYAPAALRAQLLASRLPRYTEATRTEPAIIAAELERVRERGWLITHGEELPGLVSLSAPVHGLRGEVVAALAILAPETRMRSPRPRSLVPDVVAAAAGLSIALAPGVEGGD